MFRTFFHKVSVSIREETDRLRAVMHEQLGAQSVDRKDYKGNTK